MNGVILTGLDLIFVSKILNGNFTSVSNGLKQEYAEKLQAITFGMCHDDAIVYDGISTYYQHGLS